MKRLLLAAILIFPVAALVFWFYWGASRPRITSDLPLATNAVIQTNAPSAATNPAPAKP